MHFTERSIPTMAASGDGGFTSRRKSNRSTLKVEIEVHRRSQIDLSAPMNLRPPVVPQDLLAVHEATERLRSLASNLSADTLQSISVGKIPLNGALSGNED